MKYIIRIKAVSECIGIRRSTLSYINLEDRSYDLRPLGHPLSSFKEMTLDGMKLKIGGHEELLKPGYEEFFYKNNEVKSLNKTEIERVVLGALLIPLDREMDKIYNKAIDDGESFDQWNGEFEYLLGLLYQYEFNDINRANEYFNKAEAKGFKYKLID